jgi:hypothetical protein
LDMVSATFLHDMHIGPDGFHRMIVRVNLNYVVAAAIDKVSSSKSKLYVYDLKCLKETDAVPSHLLLTRIDLDGEVVEMKMTETRLV